MDVGIRELKAKLSEYLDRVERGEYIRVTDRGRPKALIAPIPGGPDRTEERIAQGIREGWIRPGNGQRMKPMKPRYKAKRSIQEMLDEDRGD
jgi:prevent-host-death family protein